MAIINGSNYEKEWVLDPAEQADKGTRASYVRSYYDDFTGVAAADELYICRLQNDARLVSIESLSGTLGAGALNAIDKDGNATPIVAGDLVNGQVEGGLDIVLTADGATSADLDILVRWLMD
jgi:hypothetical protein